MARKRLELTVSLSFLDVMSVGLGSVILLFLIINHASEQRSQKSYSELQETVGQQQARFIEYQQTADELGKALQASQEQLAAARHRLAEFDETSAQSSPSTENLDQQRAAVTTLRQQVQSLEQQVAQLRTASNANNATIRRVDDGDRQYLTGLKVNGYRVMFLVDASASMLAPTVVGAIRRRNMSDQARRASPKWRRTVAAVEWLAAQIPADGEFQIYIFNHDVRSVLPETTDHWLKADNGKGIERALTALRQVVPGSGTSLYRALAATSGMSPRADNIYLLTDGLPTQGILANQRGNISAAHRLSLFTRAISVAPRGIPMNVILMPMEGDPMAPSAYWQLARLTGGVMLTPAKDWP